MPKKIKKFHAIIAVIILLAVFVPLNQASALCGFSCITDFWGAQAQKVADSASNAILNSVVSSIQSFFQTILGSLISWSARLLNTLIKFQINSGIYDMTITRGSWIIIRNFVNLLFILVLIVMAFGTIFSIQRYTWREMLAPFLIAALLINFSFAIGMYVIEISNGLSGIFLNEIDRVAGAGGVSGITAEGAGIGKLVTVADQTVAVLVEGVFSMIFLVIFLLAMLSAAIFTLARIFALWFLLIISPIAWFGYALPNLKNSTWSTWWNHFLCWCFWLPYFLFFLMFAVIFIKGRGSIPIPTTDSGIASNFMFFALSLLFLVGGMGIARKLACASGTGVKAAFGRIETGVRRYAPGAAYVRGAYAGLRERGAEIQEKGVLGIGGAQRARVQEAEAKGFVAGVPGLGRVPGAREEVSRATSIEVDKEVKRLQTLNLTADQLNTRFKSAKGIEKTAALKIKAENGWLSTTDTDEIAKTVREAGGGRTALGGSIIQSLKKGNFHEMAASTAEKEVVFNKFITEDVELAKAFGLSMAESREIIDQRIAEKLLDIYSGDTKAIQDKVAESVKNNIDNFARNKSEREAIVTRAVTPTTTKAENKMNELAAKAMVDKKEVDSWKLRRAILEASGGIDPATGDAKTVEGRNLAKEIKDSNVLFKAEKDYRDSHAINHSTDLTPLERTDVQRQLETDISSGLITGLSAEEMKTPEIFNAINTLGAATPPRALAAFRQKMLGKKPDRKKREAFDKALAGPPIPY